MYIGSVIPLHEQEVSGYPYLLIQIPKLNGLVQSINFMIERIWQEGIEKSYARLTNLHNFPEFG